MYIEIKIKTAELGREDGLLLLLTTTTTTTTTT